MIVLANPVQPHSEGEIRLASSDPSAAPDIRMNYFGDPHDMAVMIAVTRRALDIVAKLQADHGAGAVLVAAGPGGEAQPRRQARNRATS